MKRSFGLWLACVGLVLSLASSVALASAEGWGAIEGEQRTEYDGCKFALLRLGDVRTLDANVKTLGEKLTHWQAILETAETEYRTTRRWAVGRFFRGEAPEALSASAQGETARLLAGILDSYQTHFDVLTRFDEGATEFCQFYLDSGDDRMAEGSGNYMALERLLNFAQEVGTRFERDLEFLVFAFEDGVPSDVERERLLAAMRANESDISELPFELTQLQRAMGAMP